MTTQRKTRKTRVDSKESAVAAMIHADKRIDPPAFDHWTQEEDDVFQEIIAEFAKIDWSRHTIRIAALLARCMDQLAQLQATLVGEGYTVTTPKGGVAMNPISSAANQLASQMMSLRRTLALHATSGANKVDVGKRRGINKDHEHDAPERDGLINTPNVG